MNRLSITIPLISPPLSEILIRLLPILVALVFWGLGMGIQTFKPNDGAANLFFAWCLVCSLTLTAGVASYLGAIWMSILFSCMLWIIGPLSVHFHLDFPQARQWRWKRALLAVLYVLAILGIGLYLLVTLSRGFHNQWQTNVVSAGRVFLGLNLLLVVGLLVYHYTHAATPGVRAKIRLVALGGGIAGLSVVVFIILPDGLFHQPILPYQFTFVLLAIIPLTYGFAIYRYHLIEIEEHVNRGATNFLIYSIIGGAYLLSYTFLSRVLPSELGTFPVINAFILLLLISLFSPFRVQVQRFVDTIFYGNWYDYRLGVMQLTQNLDEIADLNTLARTVSERLVKTINLEECSVFLRASEGNFSVVEVAMRSSLPPHPARIYPVLPRSSLDYLLKIGVVERNHLKKALSEVAVTEEELQLLNSEQIRLWAPVIGHEQILGLLALGPKLGGDVFSEDDLDILRVLVRQLGPIIEKLHLLTQLRQHAAELEQRVVERTEELFNAKEHVEAILASVGDGVIVTDLDGKITRANPSFEKQSGYSAPENSWAGYQYFPFRGRRPGRFFRNYVDFTDRDLWSGDFTNQRKSGESYDVRWFIAPVHDQGGRIVSYVGSQIDITHQKELERMKDTFIADVSHELRTPTTNISLYLELLQRAPEHKKAQYIKVLKEQTQQLVKLVEDILDLSRLTRLNDSGSRFTVIDLNLIIEQIIEASQPLAQGSGLKLLFEPAPGLPLVSAEQNQISRLVSNLVSNAIRYTKTGEVRASTLLCEDRLCLEISDTGIGINSEDMPHLFERFYRGNNVRQSNIPGTGLGLAIVKEIIDLHGGSIEVESEAGRGSTFSVYLPLRGIERA